jgi:hypothetical protein
MASPSKAARGTKRTCQNPECGSRFYDLNRATIACPVCEHPYVLALSDPAAAAIDDKMARKPKTGEILQPDGEALPEGAEELVDLEADAAADPAVEADETFLEEEEEGGDVSGIVSTPGEGEEEV